MSIQSGIIAKEIVTGLLVVVAILSGGVYLSFHAEKPKALILALGFSENEKIPLVVGEALPVSPIEKVPAQNNMNAESPQNLNNNLLTTGIIQNVNINKNSSSSVLGNTNQNISTTVKVNGNENSSAVNSSVKSSSFQALVQKQLGNDFLVVKMEHKDNALFDLLTPFPDKVKVQRYIIQKNGTQIGFIYEVKKMDPALSNAVFFLRDLAIRVLKNPKVTITDAPYGKKGFYYNNIDKPDLLRIVVESKTGMTFAFDIQSQYKEDFTVFLRSL